MKINTTMKPIITIDKTVQEKAEYKDVELRTIEYKAVRDKKRQIEIFYRVKATHISSGEEVYRHDFTWLSLDAFQNYLNLANGNFLKAAKMVAEDDVYKLFSIKEKDRGEEVYA